MIETFDVELTTPVQAHGETVTVLKFREPTGRDIFDSGYPYKIQIDTKNPGASTQIFDMPPMRVLLSRTASVPTSTIDQLSFEDLSLCMGVIPYFLGRSRRKASSTALSTSRSSGETPNSASA